MLDCKKTGRFWCICWALCLGMLGSPAIAQPTDPVSKEDPIREQTIYIPYDQLRDVFEREGRGVFLPYEQFQKLWQEARGAKTAAPPAASPVDAILVSAENTATIEKEIMVVNSVITVEILKSGWQKIPLQLNDAAILSATIDKQPARIIHDPATGYSLLFQNTEEKPVKKVVELQYAKAYEKTPGQNSVSFMAPQAPVNQWRIVIAEPGVKVQIEPMLATTEPAKESANGQPATGTEVIAFVGATPSIRIRWVPKSEGATGMAPLANVQMQHRTVLEEGIMRTTAQFTYSIDRSELNQLTLSLPANQKVINVFDPNVRKWSIEPNAEKQDNAQKLVVELFEPARKAQSLVVELESKLESQTAEIASVLPIVCLDASRQQGFVAVKIGQGLRAEPLGRRGLMQMDTAELPQPMPNESWNFAYRFNSVPFDLQLKLDKVLPTIRVEQMAEVVLDPQSITIELATTHKIENAGVFQLEFDLPSDFELVQVVGRSAENVEAASIDAYRFANDSKERLVVSLNRRAIGKVGTFIQLKKKLADPNLISPTGAASKLDIPVPRSAGEFVQWIDGILIVYAPESLRINPVEKSGVRDGVTNDVRAPWRSNCLERHPGIAESVAFAHAMEPVKLTLDVERKRPFVTVRQLVNVLVEPGNAKYSYSLDTNVQYSSVATIRIDVPDELAKKLQVETAGVRHVAINPPPADVAAGYVAWELASDTPWLGQRIVQLGWVDRIEGLEIGKIVEFTVPSIAPKNTDQSWGQIVLNRKDSIDLQTSEGTTGLRPIDPRYDLKGGESFPDAARAFEFQGEWALKVAATRYALEQVKQTIIERAFVRAVVTRSNRIGVHAIYRLRNATQRLALSLPAGFEFDSQPLLINGQNASLERGSADQLFIPLVGFAPTQSLVVELRYTTPGDQQSIDLPVFPSAPAVQAAYLAVFLPKERILLASNGPWTEEFSLRARSAWKYEPQCNQAPQQLVSWAKEGVAVASSIDFQTDGVMYLYSTLKPVDPPDGSLKLQALNDRWFAAGVIGLLLVLGAALLRASFQVKVIAVALIAAIVFATGIFAPTFATQLMNAPGIIGSTLVGILWVTQGILGAVSRLPRGAPKSAEGPARSFADRLASVKQKSDNSTSGSTTADADEASAEDQSEKGGTDHV